MQHLRKAKYVQTSIRERYDTQTENLAYDKNVSMHEGGTDRCSTMGVYRNVSMSPRLRRCEQQAHHLNRARLCMPPDWPGIRGAQHKHGVRNKTYFMALNAILGV